jgi:hypothetical protein
LVKDDLNELIQQILPFKIYIQKELTMLENLLEFYRKSNGKNKKKIPGCIFAEKLVLCKAQSAELRESVSVRVHLRQGYGG